ncbi:peroxidase 2-like [Phragmites australis]|uniref:peroxidase 2-like n=1 Tax=Phragmites australis TaxID=29695 RepID=UPI002D78BAE0|nr:peroxidase 2-like [Phragmites australis]
MASRQTFSCYVTALLFSAAIVSAQLSTDFYDETCPDALDIIESAVRAAVSKESRMGASLLRLHFHDCFVNGCDGSVLLDDAPGFTGEKTAQPNKNSLRGFEVVDGIKAQLEDACNQTVSCADILAVAARDSVVALGGPTWDVELGRRDATTASLDDANNDLPAPTSDLGDLIKAFSKKGLSADDMIALSGAHTIGQARCVNFRSRLYNETTLDASLASSLKPRCPRPAGTGDDNTSPLDPSTSYVFDNFYYKNLLRNKGLLHSDQQLFSGGSADAQTTAYASDMAGFFDDFRDAMVKMGGIGVVTGSSGQVRANCRKAN